MTGNIDGPGDVLIGDPEPQVELVKELLDNGPLTYPELKRSLGYEDEKMNSVMRHVIHYNGVVEKDTQAQRHPVYVAKPQSRIEPYIDKSHQ